VTDAIKEKIIKPIKAKKLFINIIALNLFPFLGDRLLTALLNVDKKSYTQLLQDRKAHVADFIIHAIKI
jgi:hypothetical protein